MQTIASTQMLFVGYFSQVKWSLSICVCVCHSVNKTLYTKSFNEILFFLF